MSSYTLNLKVEGGNISADNSLLTADSVEYVVAAFTFDESWNNLYKTAIFRVGELVYHSPLENNSCKIPFEALKEPLMFISVFGVLDKTRATTAELPIQIQNSGFVKCEPQAPTPDPYNYFLERVTNIKDEAALYASSSLGGAESVYANKNAVEEMLEVVTASEQNAIQSSESAKSSAKQASDTLDELVNHENFLKGLSVEVQSNATATFDAAERVESAVMAAIENHNYEENDLAHPNILELAKNAKSIALGKATSLCFNTEKELTDWVAGVFERSDGKTTSDLNTGDNLYVIELGVPDYWWDGTAIQPLGAEKPNLTDYYTKSEMDARLCDASFDLISRSDYNALYSEGKLDAGRIYFVFEEE